MLPGCCRGLNTCQPYSSAFLITFIFIYWALKIIIKAVKIIIKAAIINYRKSKNELQDLQQKARSPRRSEQSLLWLQRRKSPADRENQLIDEAGFPKREFGGLFPT